MNIFTATQVAFIVLKVLDLIDWPWWEVFIPTYAGFGIALIAVTGIFIINNYDEYKYRRKK